MAPMDDQSPREPRLEPVRRWAFWALGAIALFFLFTEHRAHVFGILPYLLLAACPLLHIFGHGRHSGLGRHGSRSDRDQEGRQ